MLLHSSGDMDYNPRNVWPGQWLKLSGMQKWLEFIGVPDGKNLSSLLF